MFLYEKFFRHFLFWYDGIFLKSGHTAIKIFTLMCFLAFSIRGFFSARAFSLTLYQDNHLVEIPYWKLAPVLESFL